ncbi:MAG TPA: epoxide hydrolase [Acidimicrobiales bacterium]|jgi:pimeloyl-ACP methyl ester carboxylesterase|nr:epoxide hydrolase [Acidimicrobiales bacterium]
MSSPNASSNTDIRPFQVSFADEDLKELRRRIASARLPSRELVTDRSQGVQLETIEELARYWTSDYDMRRCESRLNALPQFKTEIDGVDIHFIHVKSAYDNALPLIMTHGWPGSVVELLETIGPLTDPTAHGGSAEDAFHLVLPSIPGYGFSDEPTEIGWGPIRIGRAWDELMSRLGYVRYVAQGGDVGSQVTDAMGRLGLDGLVSIHTNLLTPALGDAKALSASPPSHEEQAALDALAEFQATGVGYFVEQATRPETIGYALLDSPIAMAAWILDHDTDAYYKIARAFVDGKPSGNLTRDNILDNITMYWLTGTGASAARSYWEEGQETARAVGHAPTPVSIPVGFTTFPGEIWRTPRSWVEKAYPNVIYFNEVDKGGHFAAWEEPELFATEIRATFRPVR